ncbi:MAG TPA: hypothetical protein VGR72_08805 [Candidatus Acidoferrales bacterium]|nr:hypothetical protein [Candidatus Acidoferrales bacterium]
MAPPTPHRACCAAIALSALLCLASCAVPLAPGYKIEKQSITAHFVPGAPPHLAIRAEYRLANVGNSNLDSIEVGLPGQKSLGRENLRVQINGRDVTPEMARGEGTDEGESSSSESWPAILRIPFSPTWHRKQKRSLVIAYDLTAVADSRGRMYVASNMFFLNDSGWFPNPIAPKSLFAKDLVRPSPSDLRIIVPAGFQALGGGEPQGVKQSNAETEYRFRIRKDDFDPYIIAGQYHEQRVTTADGTVVFWAFKPFDSAQAQSEGAAIAAVVKDYVQTFGPLPRSMKAVYDVAFPEEMGSRITHDNHAASFLPGVVNADSEDVFARMELAETWFSHLIVPRREAWTLGIGLEYYAALVSNRDNNRVAVQNVRSVISDYDSARSHVIEKPILTVTPSDSQAQLQLADDKIQLFLLALEEKCGRDNLNHALAHMVSALRFQQYGYDDFRSSLEQECHQDLGSFFRTWLNEKGIPADFRAKYEASLEKKN